MLQPKDTDWVNGHKNKTHVYAIYKRLTSDLVIHKIENEGMDKDITCKWKSKENWSSSTHIRKIDFKIKSIIKRQGRTLHNDQGINLRQRYSCKYFCTQHRSTSVHKANANSHKRGNQQ